LRESEESVDLCTRSEPAGHYRGSDDWIPAEVEKSVSTAIAALKLEKGKKLGFYFNLPKRGEGPEIQVRVQKTVIRWATEHGLEYGNLGY
jgi:hypothetical protein